MSIVTGFSLRSLSAKTSAATTAVLATRFASSEAVFQNRPYKLYRLDTGPAAEVTVTRDDALTYYRQMQVIRRSETTANNMYKEKVVRGFCHLYTGQEAVAVGMKGAMHDEDSVITSYRCHAFTYLLGSTTRQVLCELTGRISGNVHGKGGSMHMYERNFYGGNGIVGAQIPLGAGVGFAYHFRDQKNTCFTIYGDGAANQGQLFESVNMAKLWNLPVTFVCENNGVGMGTIASRAAASTEFYARNDAVPGIWVDGMDVISVREAIRYAKEFNNAGHGPITVEVDTYRYVGHSVSDPGTSYRTRDEVQKVRKTRDPIMTFKDKIISAGLTTEEELKQIDKDVKKEIEDAIKFATTDPVLPPEGLYADLYHNTEAQLIHGCLADETIVQPVLTSAEVLQKAGFKM